MSLDLSELSLAFDSSLHELEESITNSSSLLDNHSEVVEVVEEPVDAISVISEPVVNDKPSTPIKDNKKDLPMTPNTRKQKSCVASEITSHIIKFWSKRRGTDRGFDLKLKGFRFTG